MRYVANFVNGYAVGQWQPISTPDEYLYPPPPQDAIFQNEISRSPKPLRYKLLETEGQSEITYCYYYLEKP